jgi:hypothetical protein
MQADDLAPTAAHTQLQAFQAVRSMHAFTADGPALATQHHRDALVAEPRSGLG